MTKEYGVTDTGFYRPTYDELLEGQIQLAEELFGSDIDTSNLSVLGKYIRINVSDLDKLWQTAENIYNARFPNTSSGVSLERLCVFAGITRNPATYATHTVVFTGTEGTKIEGGYLVCTEGQEQIFHTLEDYVIGEDGTVEAEVEADTAGSIGNVAKGSITSVVNPIAGVDEIVQHTAIKSYAQDTESDYELRTRFDNTIAGTGATTLEALRASVLRVTNVEDVFIRENDKDEVDEYGIAPHSFECFVLADGVAPDLIGKAILDKKSAGISPTGDIEVEVPDSTGVKHKIRFTWTTKKYIDIRMEIETDNLFPVDGYNLIAQNLTNLLEKLGNGETVYISSLYGEIHIEGVVNVKTLEMSSNGSGWSSSNIGCSLEEVARVNNVTINGETIAKVAVIDE